MSDEGRDSFRSPRALDPNLLSGQARALIRSRINFLQGGETLKGLISTRAIKSWLETSPPSVVASHRNCARLCASCCGKYAAAGGVASHVATGSEAALRCYEPAMTRYENKVFENQHLVLDDGVFINCTFKNCSLEYSGGDVHVQNCQGDGCQLVWRGSAQRTVLLLQGLGLMGPATPPTTSEPPGRVH